MAERRLKALLDAAVGASAVGLLGAVKRFDRRRTAHSAGAAMRKIGPLFKEHRLARQNLRAAFPEKSEAEIEQILAGVWDNLGRIAIEFAHLDEFCIESVGRQSPDLITYAPEAIERYRRMLDRGKPMLGFAAHLANWELPAVVAKVLVEHSAVLYRQTVAATSEARGPDYGDCGRKMAQPTWSAPPSRWKGRLNGAPGRAAGAMAAKFGGSVYGSPPVQTNTAPRARRSARSIQGARRGWPSISTRGCGRCME